MIDLIHHARPDRPTVDPLRHALRIDPKIRHTHPRISPWQMTLLASCLVLLLTSCAQDQLAKLATATTQPTSNSRPPGTMLYQADWTQGFDGWRNTNGWKIADGTLESDASNTYIITVPYMPAVSAYTIEFRLRVAHVPTDGGNFLLIAQKQSHNDGYSAGVLDLRGPGIHATGVHPQCEADIDPSDDAAGYDGHDYEPGNNWHTYRVAVKNRMVDLYIDNLLNSRNSSTATELSHGPLQIQSGAVAVQINSFHVVAG
ncbi:MAG TPA: family 16 glycoside hydrolase [Ktedonobacteraceae bacterium]|nr:family 16 glycoside hydrolase [Ktedonobacteraceae bacterium]